MRLLLECFDFFAKNTNCMGGASLRYIQIDPIFLPGSLDYKGLYQPELLLQQGKMLDIWCGVPVLHMEWHDILSVLRRFKSPINKKKN